MFRRMIIILILSLLIASCGAAAPAATQAPPLSVETPIESIIIPASATTAPLPTPTLSITDTPTIIPTDTSLPPLELPTEAANAPSKMVWDGAPTYLGDSTPGYAFRVTYDPEHWAAVMDQFGFPALGHRGIEYCVITVTSGRGLPANIIVEHDVLYANTVTYDVGVASENGVKKFMTYTGGDGVIVTAFEVSFQEDVELCIADAVTVLSTLISVPVSQATPSP